MSDDPNIIAPHRVRAILSAAAVLKEHPDNPELAAQLHADVMRQATVDEQNCGWKPPER